MNYVNKKEVLIEMNEMLNSIDFVFENCEVFETSMDNIQCFFLRGITASINAYSGHNGKVSENESAGEFYIWIKDISKVSNITAWDDDTFQKRINTVKDICAINLNYENGSKHYNLPMSDEYVNNYQHHEPYMENGIVIAIDKNYED